MTAYHASAERMFTPNEIARGLGLSARSVLNLIRDESLTAVNLARSGARRPRDAVSGEHLDTFLASRRVAVSATGKVTIPRKSETRRR
jgi:hypothetical protein